MEPAQTTESRARARRRNLWIAAAVLALALGLRLGAVFTASVHWDEFALLHLADRSHVTGVLETGGRGGLASVVLLPFVRECDDEIQVIRRARLLWIGFTGLSLCGLAAWLFQLAPPGPDRGRDAVLGVALLALVPAFIDSSLQVRTDQLALAGGTLGGAALLASRQRPAWALAAGVCLGAGFLGTQKLVYVAALAVLLAAGQLWVERELRPRRELTRGLLCVAGFVAVVAGFQLWTQHAFEPPPSSGEGRTALADLERGLTIFGFYRRTIGASQYREILPTLLPHALLLAGLVAASLRALRGGAGGRRLLLAAAVLALGVGVAGFHAAAFRYFWMTLGLFPAVALALAHRHVLELPALRSPRARRLALAGLAAALVIPGVMQMGFLLRDTQAVQRKSLAFVHRNFDRRAAGFHPESGLFCQAGVQPLPTYFSQLIYWRFGRGPVRSERNVERIEQSFREIPIAFILQSFRLNQFPLEVRRFWAENYQPYRDSVFVAGRKLEGRSGTAQSFELIVPGRYRWLPFGDARAVDIDGKVLAAGEAADFASGTYRARFVEDVPGGVLVLALEEPPGEAPRRFYQ